MFCQSLAHEKSRDTLNPADTTILEAQSDRIYMTRGLLSSWSAFFLIKKREKRTFLFPSSVLHAIFIAAPPPKKPYPSPVLTALALNTEAQSIDILLIIIVTPVRQFSWVWDWDVLVWPVNPDWNYKLSNKMLQFAFTAVSYSLLW